MRITKSRISSSERDTWDIMQYVDESSLWLELSAHTISQLTDLTHALLSDASVTDNSTFETMQRTSGKLPTDVSRALLLLSHRQLQDENTRLRQDAEKLRGLLTRREAEAIRL